MISNGLKLVFLVLLFYDVGNCIISVDDCLDPSNKIIEENCKVGNDSRDWDVNADGDPSIQGFSVPFSVNIGNEINFKIKTDSKVKCNFLLSTIVDSVFFQDYFVDIFRVGWYWGSGARHVDRLYPSSVSLPQHQPDCSRDGDTLLYDCAAWHVSVTWHVPGDAVSGVFLARLTRSDGEESWRSDNSQYPADARFSFPDDTPGQLPAPPQPWSHAYGAQGQTSL